VSCMEVVGTFKEGKVEVCELFLIKEAKDRE